MRTFYLLLLLGLLLWQPVYAQNGLLSGKITDEQTGQALPGASLRLEGTTNGTATDLNGEYRLSLPVGSYQLLITFIGFTDKKEAIEIQAGQTTVLNLSLVSEAFELNGIVVTGQLEGQVKALNQQRSAINIKNIVAADQIGRFPDPNAAEALQRVPGVNIERDQGEGRYVLVRGLAPQFTNVSVNGEQIPSPEADVRFVALDAVPADQLASMEVTKALTPDMDGDAIGGSVNLITRTAQSKDPSLSASLVGGYNNLMRRPNIQGALQYGQRFGQGEKFGVMLNSSYYHNELGSDNWEREPFDNELELRDYELVRTRLGLSTTLDYRFDANNEVYVRALYARFSDREWRRRYIFIPEDEEIERATKDRYESQSILSLNVGGRHSLPKVSIDYEFSYSYAEQDTPYDYEGSFIAGIPSTLDFGDGADYPVLTAPGYLDNSEYEFNELELGQTLAKDENITARINIGLPYQLGNASGLFKFGGKVRFKTKSFEIINDKYENRGGVPNLDFFQGGLLDDRFLDNRFTLAPNLDVQALTGYLNANPAQFELQIEDKAIDQALESYEAEENVYAAYLMTQLQFNKLTLLGGIRYESTEVNYKSNDVVIAPNGDLQAIIPREGGTTYDFFLPQLHLKYALNDLTNLRFAATFSYARPNFADIVPAQEANLEDREASVGNPELKPVGALNLDFLGEKYFGNVGVLSGGVFYKRLNDFIFPRVIRNSQYPLVGPPVVSNVDVTQIQNGESADLFGFELAYQQNLSFLPGFLSGFGVYVNYTYTSSTADIQSRSQDNATETIDLPGQAEHVGNFSLSYDSKNFSARVALNFNGKYLQEVGGAPEEDIFVKSRLQLDASASYTIIPKLRVFAEFLNLTNQPFETFQGSENILIQREFYSWWSRLGLKFDL
ncbi:MAG: TonB-dependent receptor [Microscillaceae bacterium]|nr:TonB-dependent receptor [Microscillaceae bacterium]